MDFTAPDGRELWFSDAGAGPPLVFVHGGGSDGKLWADDLAPLTDQFRIVTYNRRGYPDSGPPPDSWTTHADDAAAVAESLGSGSVPVVGYSIGSVAALELAIRHPELVSRLILVDPAFRVRSHMTPGLLRAFGTAQLKAKLGRKQGGLATWLRYALGYSTGGSAWDRFPPERRTRLQVNVDGVFGDFATGDGSHIDPDDIRSIAAQTVLISAGLSPPFLKKSSAWLADQLPAPEVHTIANSGHAIAFDRPSEFLSLLRNAAYG